MSAPDELRELAERIDGEVDEITTTEVLRLAELVLQALNQDGGLHAAALKIQTGRVALLERLVEELAQDCDERADCSIEGDGSHRPNFAMQLLAKIRRTVPK